MAPKKTVKAVPAAKKATTKAAKPAVAGEKFDPNVKYTGVVKSYNKQNGYGFITMDKEGVVEKNEVFAYWKTIVSTDRYPFLHKGLEVEFGLNRRRDGNVGASQITLRGGGPIELQADNDSSHKSFLTGQDNRYSGHLKFYDTKKGFGYLTVSDTIPELNGNSELRVERQEVNCGGKQPEWMKDLDVEFGIWVTKKGEPRAYNMTGVGGMALTREFLENRTDVRGNRMNGTVELWNFKKGWGFIKPSGTVPKGCQAALKKMLAESQARAAKKDKEAPTENLIYVRRSDLPMGTRLFKDTKVSFELYTDDKGVGATNVLVV